MSELDQPATLPPSPTAAAPPQPPQPNSPPNTNTAAPQPHTDSLGKRQRRPSVRLGEIGDQTPPVLAYEPNPSRAKHSNKSSKTRPLTNLVQNGGGDCHQHQTLDAEDRNFSGEGQSEFGGRKLSTKKGTMRRAKTNWSSKMDDRDDVDDDDPFEAADVPLKDHSPVHSIDNETLSFWNRRPVRARVSDNELDNMHHESDSRDRKCDSSADGVRDWLIGLGLGRYAPVFEIHEVDDEVLPLLTLDDLKDMGINAVGSRRKMYTAIQKLRKGFS